MQQVISFITTNWVWIAFITLYICNLLLGKRSQLDHWVLRHPKLGGFLKILRGALPGEPFMIIQGLTLVIKGTLPSNLLPLANAIEPTETTPPKI
jgi:hypothetical protein